MWLKIKKQEGPIFRRFRSPCFLLPGCFFFGWPGKFWWPPPGRGGGGGGAVGFETSTFHGLAESSIHQSSEVAPARLRLREWDDAWGCFIDMFCFDLV